MTQISPNLSSAKEDFPNILGSTVEIRNRAFLPLQASHLTPKPGSKMCVKSHESFAMWAPSSGYRHTCTRGACAGASDVVCTPVVGHWELDQRAEFFYMHSTAHTRWSCGIALNPARCAYHALQTPSRRRLVSPGGGPHTHSRRRPGRGAAIGGAAHWLSVPGACTILAFVLYFWAR